MPELPRLEDHVLRIMDNQMRMNEVIGEASWQADMGAETLSFVDASGRVLVTLPIWVIGSQSEGTWLWSWANEASGLSESITEPARKLRDASEPGSAYRQIGEFPLPTPEFGVESAILCAGLSNAFGYYRAPLNHPEDAAYLVIESFPAAQKLPMNPMRTIRAITTAISALSFNHREAVRAFLGEPNAEGLYDSAGISITFDAQDRIADMGATLTKESIKPAAEPAGFMARMKKMLGKQS